VTNTLVCMAGRASNTAGNAAGRYNLRPRGRHAEGGLRGAAALADSPLLGRLLGELTDVFDAEVLPLLDPTTRALLGRVGQACRDAVLRSHKLPCAGRTVGVKLQVEEFVWSVQLLAWAKANGCPWDWRCCALAAGSGCVEVLRWAREHGCDWDEETCADAAVGGHLEVLKWAREHGCPWVEVDEDDGEHIMNCCALAAENGHLEVLQWLREQDSHCSWNEKTCAVAARSGHLEVLKWAREHGCPWEEDLEGSVINCCVFAAFGGHLDVLKWLREQNCPWDALTCAAAADGGNLEVLKWAREQHCPWDAQTRQRAEEHGHLELLQWAVEHGAP